MNIDAGSIIVGLSIFIQFITFVGVFTKLEARLTALEKTLEATEKTLTFISSHLITMGLADRRGDKQ